MRIASIDVGTNTALMLIADVSGRGDLSVIRDEHSIVRLGRHVDATRRIHEERIDALVEQLKSYKLIAERERCDAIIVTGTSALRDAGNRVEVLSIVKERTGLLIRVLSPDEEARETFRGATSDLAQDGTLGSVAVLDIGGGSTEIVIRDGREILTARSIDIGAVRMTERFWPDGSPSVLSFEECRRSILENLGNPPQSSSKVSWIGVAGTMTTLAAIDLGLRSFDPSVVHGRLLSHRRIQEILSSVGTLHVAELRKHPSIEPGRADIIVAGVTILDVILAWARVDHIRVSVRGLRYGVALSEAERSFETTRR